MARDEPLGTSEAETLDTTKVADGWRMSLTEGVREALDEMDEEWEPGDKILFDREGDSIYFELVDLGTTEITEDNRISLIVDVRDEFAEMGREVQIGDRMVFERVGDRFRIEPT